MKSVKPGKLGKDPGAIPASFTVKAGSVEVAVYKNSRVKDGRTYEEFVVAHYATDGRRIRRSFSDAGKARLEAGRVAAALSRGQAASVSLTDGDAAIYGAAVESLRPFALKVNVAVNEYVEARSALPPGASLLEAVRDFCRRHPANVPQRTVAQVVTELVADRRNSGCSSEHVRDIEKRLEPFGRAFACSIGSVTAPRVREYLGDLRGVSGKLLTNRSRDNSRRLIVSLFNFARQQGYVSRDLAEEIGEVPRPKLEAVETGVFTPQSIRTLLEGADDELRAAIAIGAFAGLRTAEIHRLEWTDIRLVERVIVVGADKAKTASRRVVPIADNLALWLTGIEVQSGKLTHHTHEHQLAWDFCKLARRAGTEWVKNGLRHSFCSYRLALTGNAPQTAYEAGNSVGMIDRHYRALVTAADAAEWFAISPRPGAIERSVR